MAASRVLPLSKLAPTPHSETRRADAVASVASAWIPEISILLCLVLVAVILQSLSGAQSAAFGAEPDEAAHYTTALMIRDYLAQGMPGNPQEFAENFYLRYPRVAFGIWPPLFHLAAGVWMFLFGSDRTTILVLMALTAGLLAFALYRAVKNTVGKIPALLSALLLLSLPEMQRLTASIMLDLAGSLAVFLAILTYGKYLDTERSKHSIWFGVFAGLALMVKYNAFALVLLPPLCVVMTGRYRLLKTTGFWIPLFIVSAIIGPWYFIMRRLVIYAAEPGSGGFRPLDAALFNARGMVELTFPLLFAVACVGAWAAIRQARNSSARRIPWPQDIQPGIFVAASAGVVIVWLFHSFLYPISSERYLIPAAPCLILLAWPPLQYLMETYRPAWRRMKLAMATVLLLVPYAAFSFEIPRKNASTFVDLANLVLAQRVPPEAAILVSSDAAGEGMIVAEVAMRGLKSHYVVRASKLLADRDLMMSDYRLLYNTPEEIVRALDAVPINLAVIEDCTESLCGAHAALLWQTAQAQVPGWQLLETVRRENGNLIRLYRLPANGRAVRGLQVDMRRTLGKTIGIASH
jgi:hypothetical protein